MSEFPAELDSNLDNAESEPDVDQSQSEASSTVVNATAPTFAVPVPPRQLLADRWEMQRMPSYADAAADFAIAYPDWDESARLTNHRVQIIESFMAAKGVIESTKDFVVKLKKAVRENRETKTAAAAEEDTVTVVVREAPLFESAKRASTAANSARSQSSQSHSLSVQPIRAVSRRSASSFNETMLTESNKKAKLSPSETAK